MAYFLGKNTRTPVLDEFLGRQLSSAPRTSISPQTTTRPTTTRPTKREGIPTETLPEPEPAVTEGSYVDDLMAAVFGPEFENIRGLGGRTRESMFDFLAREGLLGTGAARDIAQETAWQTERGITDLTRQMIQWREAQEQDAFNQLLQYLFGMRWGG